MNFLYSRKRRRTQKAPPSAVGGGIITGPTEMPGARTDCREQLYASESDNLDEVGQFLRRHTGSLLQRNYCSALKARQVVSMPHSHSGH